MNPLLHFSEAKTPRKDRGFGGAIGSNEEEKRRQRRLGKEPGKFQVVFSLVKRLSLFMQDPSTNKARKTLLSETAEQVFQIGDLELPLLVPAYVTFSARHLICFGYVKWSQLQTLEWDMQDLEVLDYKRFALMVEAGAGTVSDIVWQHWRYFSPKNLELSTPLDAKIGQQSKL